MTWWKRNSNTVLMIVELVGFVGTVVTTAIAAPKVAKKIESIDISKDDPIPKKAVKTVRAVGRDCVTPLIFGTITISAMIGCKRQYMSQQAAIASSYTMFKRMYDENKEKVNEALDDICPLDLKNPSAFDEIEVSMNGDPDNRNDIFFLEYSGRRFKSSLSDVKEALDIFDEQFLKSGCASFNDLYVYLGIAETRLGAEYGFADMKRMNNPYCPESDWDHIEYDIRKVTKATGINAEDAQRLEESGKYIYMISFNNYSTDVAFYQDMCNWAISNGLHESL